MKTKIQNHKTKVVKEQIRMIKQSCFYILSLSYSSDYDDLDDFVNSLKAELKDLESCSDILYEFTDAKKEKDEIEEKGYFPIGKREFNYVY